MNISVLIANGIRIQTGGAALENGFPPKKTSGRFAFGLTVAINCIWPYGAPPAAPNARSQFIHWKKGRLPSVVIRIFLTGYRKAFTYKINIKQNKNCIKQPANGYLMQFSCGAPAGIRTRDLLIRSQALYPAELRAHIKLKIAVNL